jgi:hypothetical protein
MLYAYPAASPHSYQTIAGYHGQPPPGYCIHALPGFATWHRAYLLKLEHALQCIYPQVTVPFWDWSTRDTTGLPAACSSPTYVNRQGATVPNPLYRGPLPPGGPGTWTSRGSNIDTTSFGDLATQAQTALTNMDFPSFQSALNNVHGLVHVRVGGNMGSVPYAAFDPIFYLHHANVDRLWAAWQATHPEPFAANEANLSLEPFLRPGSSDYYVGQDMFSTDALGYRYRTWCLLRIPWRDLVVRVRFPHPWDPEAIQQARLVLRASAMARQSLDLRVFFNQPKANASSKTLGNPLFGGSFGLFGMADATSTSKGTSTRTSKARTKTKAESAKPLRMARPGQRFDLELDVTGALSEALRRGPNLSLSFVPVGTDGKVVKGKLDFESVELAVR